MAEEDEKRLDTNSKQLCAAVYNSCYIIAGPISNERLVFSPLYIFAPSNLFFLAAVYRRTYVRRNIYLYMIGVQRHHISCQPGPVGRYCYLSPCTRPRNTQHKKLGGLIVFFLAEPSSLIVEPKLLFFLLGT